jgi:thiopeptide-type bacteriocin biosynthesis protein
MSNKNSKTNNKKNQVWISAYIYTDVIDNVFLVQVLNPCIQFLEQNFFIKRFFYIIYWENGLHCRLRILANEEQQITIKNELMISFNNYFLIKSPQLSIKNCKGEIINTVLFKDYEPEIERYGGKKAIRIAEEQFQYSSEAVIQAMINSKNWNYQASLLNAFRMHLIMIFSTNINLQDSICFFDHLYCRWRVFSEQIILDHKYINKNIIIETTFQNFFDKHKQALIENLITVLSVVSENFNFEEKWLNQWMNKSKIIFNKLNNLNLKNEIITLDSVDTKSESTLSKCLWPIYESYLHMTNNRIGVFNLDEPFIYYLIKESINEYSLLKENI